MRHPAGFKKNGGKKLRPKVTPSLLAKRHGNLAGDVAALTSLTVLMQADHALREFRNAKRELAAQVLSAQEKERQRISSELHDSIGSTLSAIKFYVEHAIWQISERAYEQSAQMFRNIVPQLQYAIDEVRRIAMDLRPPLLDDIGALATLTWFVREYQGVYQDIRVDLNLDIEESDIPPILKVEIFRIVQEAMNNCAKYSHASCACVSLVNSGAAIDLAIVDNGQGFDPVQARAQKNTGGGGIGLASMRERAELSGGEFSIESARGECTKVHVVWPLQPAGA